MMPNFLIIGAAKSGTTSLYNYLKQHPQVYLSQIKETEFFAFENANLEFRGQGNLWRPTITKIENYESQFEDVSSESAIGEASTIYLYSPKAVERIKHYIPETKLIAVLRNPVDRAYSHFLHHIRDGYEHISEFDKAIKEEKMRIKNGWSWNWNYINIGFYYQQIERYFANFGKNQIRIYLYENFLQDPKNLLQNIFGFVNVNTNFVPDTSQKYNVTGLPKSRLLHSLYSKQSFIKNILKKIIPDKTRKKFRISIKNRNLIKPPMSIKTKKN